MLGSPPGRINIETGEILRFNEGRSRRFRAFEAVNGITGNGLLDNSLLNETPELNPPRGQNAVYALALP